MPVAEPVQRPVGRALTRFFQTPKGITLLLLLPLVVAAGPHAGSGVVAAVARAIDVAIATDAVFVRARRGVWVFPTGALLTGLFVGMVLAPQSAWYVAPLATAMGIASKHLLRTRWSNVFNPAALALLAAALLLHAGESWWGALPNLSWQWLILLLGAGLLVSESVNKLPLVVAFVGGVYAVFTAAAFVGSAAGVAEVFRAPDLNAILFFACFMLTDPPTSPAREHHQVWFGLLVAAASGAVFLTVGAQWYLLGGLLVGNACESVRRVLRRPAARMAQPPQTRAQGA